MSCCLPGIGCSHDTDGDGDGSPAGEIPAMTTCWLQVSAEARAVSSASSSIHADGVRSPKACRTRSLDLYCTKYYSAVRDGTGNLGHFTASHELIISRKNHESDRPLGETGVG